MNDFDSPFEDNAIASRMITLRRFVAVEIVLTLAILVLALVEQSVLPPVLQEFHRQSMARFGGREIAILLVSLPLMIATIVAWIALWRGWRIGRMIYTIVWICGLPILLLAGPNVQSAIHALVDAVATLIGGVILGLLYFSELRRVYERPR